MAAEPSRVVLRLTNDPRLVPGVLAAVDYFAQRAGLDAEAQRDLALAAEQACTRTLGLLGEDGGWLNVSVESFLDRIEITLEHRGQPLPAAGLETFAGLGDEPGEPSGRQLLSRVDRVLFHTEGQASRMTLVKYLPSAPR